MRTLRRDTPSRLVFLLNPAPAPGSLTVTVRVYPDREQACDPVYEHTHTATVICGGWVSLPLEVECGGALDLDTGTWWVELADAAGTTTLLSAIPVQVLKEI